MSLMCCECRRGGEFDTLIVFEKNGVFDPEKSISNFENAYIDCAFFEDFRRVEHSRFMIVQKRWLDKSFTASKGAALKETKYKLIDEETLRKRFPRTFAELTK